MAGCHSVDPGYAGPLEATLEYRLENGQVDRYPACWALPAEEVQRALEHFRLHGTRPPWVNWVED